MRDDEKIQLAERVRKACIVAAQEGLQLGGMSGLCVEGQLEMAVDAMRSLDLDKLVNEPDAT